MKFYVSGKLARGEKTVREVVRGLMARGHTITFDWTEDKSAEKPYLEHIEINRPVAKRMLEGASDCDGFILLVGENLLGALIEFGIAVGGTRQDPFKRLYIVGEDFRQSIFYVLPQATICKDVDDLLADIAKLGATAE